MLVEKNLVEALKSYSKGKKVLVLTTMCDGSISCDKLEDLFSGETHFLVDVPAYNNPEFEAAVHGMINSGSDEPEPEPTPSNAAEVSESENFVGGVRSRDLSLKHQKKANMKS